MCYTKVKTKIYYHLFGMKIRAFWVKAPTVSGDLNFVTFHTPIGKNYSIYIYTEHNPHIKANGSKIYPTLL